VARALRGVDPELVASVGFVETAALRPWPGNVRELLREVVRAGHRALEARAEAVEAEHLLAEAGAVVVFDKTPKRPAAGKPVGIARWSDEDIQRALSENAGNVRATARALDVHRNQLRRWLEKKG
jgi:ActR/RegA family two-component response regulator